MKKKTTEDEILERLSERVDRAVKLIAELRRERDELKEKLASHEEIRTRIEAILANLEQLEE